MDSQITFDETLSEAVRDFPVIYDKSRSGHKDRLVVQNAWKQVSQRCGLEDNNTAKRLFENLKKSFNK